MENPPENEDHTTHKQQLKRSMKHSQKNMGKLKK